MRLRKYASSIREFPLALASIREFPLALENCNPNFSF